MTTLRFLALVALVFVVGCASPTSQSRRVRLDERSKAILAGATRVEAFRIDPEKGPWDDKPRQEGERRIGGYLITAQGTDQGREFAQKLAASLSDENNYKPNDVECFMPGVAFRVWKGEEFAEMLICFKCSNFYYGPPTNQARESASFAGSLRSHLVRLTKEAFPDDKEIQALKE